MTVMVVALPYPFGSDTDRRFSRTVGDKLMGAVDDRRRHDCVPGIRTGMMVVHPPIEGESLGVLCDYIRLKWLIRSDGSVESSRSGLYSVDGV